MSRSLEAIVDALISLRFAQFSVFREGERGESPSFLYVAQLPKKWPRFYEKGPPTNSHSL
jgi:hypothetical protein